MSFDEVLADSQSEAATLHFRTGNAEVTVEDTLVVTRVDALAEIADEYLHDFAFLAGTDDDAAVLRRVVDGVRQKVCQDPGNLFAVDKEFGDFLRILDLYMAAETLRLHTVRLDGIVYQFDWLGDFRVQLQFSGFHLRHFEVFAGYFEQAVAAFLDAFGKRSLFVVHIAYPLVFQEFETHHDG